MSIVKIIKLNESANIPHYSTSGSAGVDVAYSGSEIITLEPSQRKIIQTGLSIALEKGYEAQIRPRSGLAAKNGITVLNTPGTIDSDYRGEIKVILINLSDQKFDIEPGMRIAQMVITKYEIVKFQEVQSLDETKRGDSGFGSTGTK